MRALTVEELGFVSGGVETDGWGNPLPDYGNGWNNYRNPIKDTGGPFSGDTSFEALGGRVDNPFSTFGRMIDDGLRQAEIEYHNQMVKIVNRDRNGDGQTTDGERQTNWNIYQAWVAAQKK